jgi:hypothetical protein
MIRTIHEHHQSYRRLMELAKRAPIERWENLLKVARLGLKFAQLQLRDPSQRPDTRMRMSADQYRAIAECLSAKPELAKRACYLEAMAESATLNDWPSSATAPYLVLTAEELEALADAPFWTHQRVSAPYLTATEQAALRQHAKEALALARKAFSEENS